ncbi:MAG: peptidylprolyl isomerase [Kiritimatiellales bacterium]|nr:peptidylprolyl isomerase [Kiritimatiellota bacterium]MBL7011701.1 peptidylprolyl isomerase [Kiritimatiellales bacterium]
MACGAVVAAPVDDGMYATIQTTLGDVCFELYYTNVPRTVANFVSLAEGTRPWIDPRSTFISNDPYYDGIIFHRVITNFMIQCGSPKGDGTDGPGYTFEDEFDPSLRHDRPGIVSMANSGPNSNGGQFFITVKNTDWLDNVHSVFGSVVEGMNVVSNIAAVAVGANDRPLVDVVITNVFITRNGANALVFLVTNQCLPEVEVLPIEIAVDDGVKISTGTAMSSYQYIYSSTNLSYWAKETSKYWPETDGDWEVSVFPKEREFFRANRVVYEPNTNITVDVTAHQLVMTINTDVFDVSPDVADSGVVFINHELEGHNITFWDWGMPPYPGRLFFESDGYVPFRFDLYYQAPTNGFCKGYYYNGGWISLGTGTFTDQVLPD